MRRGALLLLALAACSRRQPPPPPLPAPAAVDLFALPLAVDFEGSALFRTPGGEPRRVGDVEIRSAGPDPRLLEAEAFLASRLEGAELSLADVRVEKGSLRGTLHAEARALREGRVLRWFSQGQAEFAVGNGRWLLRRYRGTGARVEEGPLRFEAAAGPDFAAAPAAADVDNDGDLDFCEGGTLRIDAGDGRFEERPLGVERATAAAFGDVDGDGDADLALSTDGEGLRLFLNRGGDFAAAGVFEPNRGAGLLWVDVDDDGDLDLVAAGGGLLRNDGKGGLRYSALERSGEQVAAWDVDNDGRPQLLMTRAGKADLLFWRTDRGFEELGTGLAGADGRGVRVADLDGDGTLEAQLRRAEGVEVLRRRAPAPGRWIGLRLRGRASNAAGVGTRVWVNKRLREASGADLHVGLGAAETADVELRWPSGQVDRHAGLEPGRLWTLAEGDPDPEADK